MEQFAYVIYEQSLKKRKSVVTYSVDIAEHLVHGQHGSVLERHHHHGQRVRGGCKEKPVRKVGCRKGVPPVVGHGGGLHAQHPGHNRWGQE